MSAILRKTSLADALWDSAFKQYLEDCGPKVADDIRRRNHGPQDLLDYIEQRRRDYSDSRYSKILRVISSFGARFKGYQSALDIIAQGVGKAGCFIWGPIRLVLGIVQTHANAFERLLRALEMMGDRLPIMESYANIFHESPEYHKYIVKSFSSMIRFWSKALRFHSQSYVWGLLRSIRWNYDAEFSGLEHNMDRYYGLIQDHAEVMHMEEARMQHDNIKELLQSVKKEEVLALTRWLSPENYEVRETWKDLERARDMRQQGTCVWILENPAFQAWKNADSASENCLLWLSAVPGAGKTILGSFIIDHLCSPHRGAIQDVLFFMFKSKDPDKDKAISAAISLNYQLLKTSHIAGLEYYQELVAHQNESGQLQAKDFESLWQVFRSHLGRLSSVAVIIDGLDECRDFSTLANHLKQLSMITRAKVIILSRREPELCAVLEGQPEIMMRKHDNGGDIAQYLDKQVEASEYLRKTSVSVLVSRTFGVGLTPLLLERANGSFLWASLALKELRRQYTPDQIVDTLNTTPAGVSQLYRSILLRYDQELSEPQKKICSTVLRWLACAIRPLSTDQVWEALKIEHTPSDANMILDEDFLLSKSQVIDCCGSLVALEDEVIQLAHLSLAEFLCTLQKDQSQGTSVQLFYVKPPEDNLRVALACISYLDAVFKKYRIDPEQGWRQLNTNQVLETSPLLEYATKNLTAHLKKALSADCKQIPVGLQRFCLGINMLYWLEAWFAIVYLGLWSIKKEVSQLSRNCAAQVPPTAANVDLAVFLGKWSRALGQLLNRHGASLSEEPSNIHYIDPASFEDKIGDGGFFSAFEPPRQPFHTQHLRIPTTMPYSNARTRPCDNKLTVNQGQRMNLPRFNNQKFGMFHIDTRRNVMFLCDYVSPNARIYCQDLIGGDTLRPMTLIQEEGRHYRCEGYSASSNGKHLAIYLRSYVAHQDAVQDSEHHLFVMDLPEDLSFADSHRQSWSKVLVSFSSRSAYGCYCPQPVTFTTSDTVTCPYGRLSISSGSLDSSHNVLQSVSSLKEKSLMMTDLNDEISFVIETCHIVVYAQSSTNIYRVSLEDPSMLSAVQCPLSKVILCCASCDGRFAVWHESGNDRLFGVQDLINGTVSYLPGSEDILFPAHLNLKFARNGLSLMGIMRHPSNTAQGANYVSAWAIGSSVVKQSNSGIVGLIAGFDFKTLEEPAYLAVSDQWIEFDPRNLSAISTKLGIAPHYQHGGNEFKVSSDGCRLAIVGAGVRQNYIKWVLEIIHLKEGFPSRSVYLHSPESPDRQLQEVGITISPDLRFVLIDDLLYDVGLGNDEAHPFTVPTPRSRRSSLVGHELGDADLRRLHVQARFSGCQQYMISVDSGSIRPLRWPVLTIYYIDLQCRRVAQLDLPQDLHIQNCSWIDASFHPMIPIISVVTMRVEVVEGHREHREVFECYIIRLARNDSRCTKLEGVFSREVESLTRCKDDAASFLILHSACGVFVVLRNDAEFANPDDLVWLLPLQISSPIKAEILPNTIDVGSPIHCTLWGSPNVFLRIQNFNGDLFLTIMDSMHGNGNTLFRALLPSYLAYVRPVMILRNDFVSQLQVIFMSRDREPELMTFRKSWEQILEETFARARKNVARLGDDAADAREIRDLSTVLRIERQITDLSRTRIERPITIKIATFYEIANKVSDIEARYREALKSRSRRHTSTLYRRHSTAFS